MKLKLPKPKKSRPSPTARRGGPISIWVYGLVVAVAGVAACGYIALQGLQRQQSLEAAAVEQLAAQSSQLLAARLQQRLQSEFATLAEVAAQSGVEAVLAGADAGGGVAAAFPGALRVLVVPAGMNEPDLEAQPPIGYALLDMMRKAEQERKAPPAEVHLPGQDSAHLNFLQPVVRQGEVRGHLVVSYAMDYLRTAVSGLQGGGVTLQQGGAMLLRVGNAEGGVTKSLAVPGSRWQLVYAAPAGLALPAEQALLLPAAAGGALLLVTLLAFFLMRRQVIADGQRLVAIFHDTNEEQRELEYPASLAEFRPLLSSALIEARRFEERLPVTPAAPGSRASELPPDTMSGLEVREEKPAPKPTPGVAAEPVRPAAGARPRPAVAESRLEVAEAPAAAEPLLPEAELDFTLPDEAKAASAGGAGLPIRPEILRAYDVRGIVGAGLDVEVVRAFGQAIGAEAAAAGQQEIVVARDGRLSSPELAEALIEGLVAAGRLVVDIGRVPTPVMNFATHHLGTGAGVMVTGSHNPKEYNGLKIVIGGQTLSGEAIQALGRRVVSGNVISGSSGSLRKLDVLPDYLDRITQDVTLHRPLRIVVDCGNGVAGEVAPQVFRAMGCEVEELFCEVDGYFPNHHPDPATPQNLDALISLVRLQGADLGLAFDGDGDRLGVVDAKGKIIWADRQLMLFARDVLARNPGADIVFDVKCSSRLAQLITENAGVPVMWKTGHSMIRQKLHELQAPLGGDMSGHIFFGERWYGFDDAIYAGARLLEILSMEERGTVEVFAELPEAVATPEIRVDLAEGEAVQIMSRLQGRLPKAFKDARVTSIDGIRLDLPDGWALVRASNTQPCLSMRFEGVDKDALRRLQEAVREHLLAVRPDLSLPF